MQTILGSGGAIGTPLASNLRKYTSDIRLVSRNPKAVDQDNQLFAADLTQKEMVYTAIEGSEIVYLTIGLPYSTKVWEQHWTSLIQHVVDACIQYQTRLVFFDNVYAISKDHIHHITETSPLNPCSKKGSIRAAVEKIVMDAVEKRNLQAIIARSADFFGPIKTTSMMMNTVYDNLAKGKKAQWLCNAKLIHSMSYTPDVALGTALLGNTKEAYNQVWNLPTDPRKITGEEWIRLFAKELGTSDQYTTLPVWALKLLGIFIPVLKETVEMCYQFDRDYFFDSSKFNTYFNFTPTTHAAAVKQTVNALKLS